MNTDTIRIAVVADQGPVADAAVILAERTTLAEHVTITRGEWTTEVAIYGDIPFEMWGSGTQALWRLLSAIAYTADGVSLYEVASRLDSNNSRAAADALAVLFGGDPMIQFTGSNPAGEWLVTVHEATADQPAVAEVCWRPDRWQTWEEPVRLTAVPATAVIS